MSSIVSSQDLGAAVDEQQNVSNEYYESNDKDIGSLAGTLEENKRHLKQQPLLLRLNRKHRKRAEGV